jgi:molybdopterin-containing oxidoreductase family membrane subunit
MKLSDYIPFKENISLGFEKTPVTLALAGVTIALILFYLYGVANFFAHGHHAYNVTREHPWGFLVASYEFFVAVAMGSIVTAASGIFFEIEVIKPLTKRLLLFGLLSLFAGFTAFLFEVGHPVTMVIYTALSGNVTSALFWLGVFYPMFMLFTVLTFISYSKNIGPTKIFALFAIIFANSSVLTAGSIFGLLNTRLFSSGVFFQIEFMATAILGGIFLLTLITVMFKKEEYVEAVVALKKVSIVILSLLLIMYIVRYLTGVYGGVPGKADAIHYIYTSSNFLIFELGLGIVFPLFVAAFGSHKKIGMFCMASFFGLVGIMFSRINLIEGVQVVPLQTMKIKEYQEVPSLITSYTPSMTELGIGLGAIGVFILFMFVADRVLELDEVKA